MAKVDVNSSTLAVTVESSLAVAGTTWYLLEPNDITDFGATITTTPRRPISKNRQLRKGVTTDLDSAVGFEHDLVLGVTEMFAEQFLYSTEANGDLQFRAAAVTSTGYTISAATSNQATKVQFNSGGPISLFYAVGYTTTANNGLKPINTDLAAADTEIKVTGLTAEASPPSNARLMLAGIRATTGDLAITVSGTTATLTSGNNSVSGASQMDFTKIGIFAGQFIHIGGTASGQQFSAGYGFARVLTIAAASVTLDKVQGTLATDSGATDTVDLLFSGYVRNLPVGTNTSVDAQYLTRSVQFELTSPDLGGVGTDQYEYALGNYGDQIAFNLPLTDKPTMTFGFIGTDTETPVGSGSRKSGASTPISPLRTDALSTASSYKSLRLSAVSASGACFKNLTVTAANNVSPEKCQGTLGASFLNTGQFVVTLTGEALLTDPALITAIRNNTTVTFDAIMFNGDGAVALDIPSMTVGGGGRDFPQDESVHINFEGTAFADATLNTSMSLSFFPVVPS